MLGSYVLGRLFGSAEAGKELVSGVRDGLDALVYTDEEKAEAHARDISESRQMMIEWFRNTQGQNLARRLIALVVTCVWALQYTTAQLLAVTAVWFSGPVSERLVSSSKIIGGYGEATTGAMMLVLAFYFAAPHMGKVVDRALDRFSQGMPK